jgi:D-aminoacyl-tRNA deacylase
MRAVIQRVSKASVTVDGEITGNIGCGLVVLLGLDPADGEADLEFMKRKLLNLRIFSDSDNKFNLSLSDIGGEILLVSQFTLYGDCRKGNRPSFSRAAPPELAEKFYERLREQLENSGIGVASGIFGAHMEVSLLNDGPVTLILDSKKGIH